MERTHKDERGTRRRSFECTDGNGWRGREEGGILLVKQQATRLVLLLVLLVVVVVVVITG